MNRFGPSKRQLAISLVLAQAVFGQPAWRRLLPPGTHSIPASDPKSIYSVLVSLPIPADQATPAPVAVKVGAATGAAKPLHAGDGDLYTLIRGGAGAHIVTAAPVAVQVTAMGQPASVEAEPNDSPATANLVQLGQTIWASGDEASYIPAEISTHIDQKPLTDWFRFEWKGGRPQLLYLSIELVDRDNIPVDVSLHRMKNGAITEHTDGEDPVTLPHEVQALPGNKFTTRILSEPGTYYVRVNLSHPFYRLQTRLYDPPVYRDPALAAQTAIDYLIGAGDSWHANTPRRGGIFHRAASNHQETTLCVACHVTHFTQRAQLYAVRNGYRVNYPHQLSFLAERFYNNPRPLYGFEAEGAVWARVISAAANVLSRMSHLLSVFETELTGDRRSAYHQRVGEYLKIYYKDRVKLPGDETNGNTPLVSPYEVAWYSWEVTRDPAISALIEQDHEIKNTIDLCYQTLALAAIDKTKHAAKIQSNAQRILALQRGDGQWSARFDEKSFAAEFQTGHALWALHAAGIPRDNPQVAKGLAYLLGRQQPFGGWLDPLQTYENFRTPFRETQMAVLALTSYYPVERKQRPWGAVSSGPPATLESLNNQWDRPDAARIAEIEALTSSPEPLIRAQALETLGRFGVTSSLPGAIKRLEDPSKLVARSAAWTVRQIYNRRPETPAEPLIAALKSGSERQRWGASRVFASHFSAMARRDEFAEPLLRLLGDKSPAVALHAVKASWQYWYWTPSTPVRERIENEVLGALKNPLHPWVERGLKESVYNLADENIRYLYNNWVPVIAKAEDRERVIRGRLAIEDRLAAKFADVLEKGSALQARRLLAGLSEFELRRGDVYDPKADRSTPFPAVYNRIGNDVETTVFFGPANDRMARAIAPYLKSDDAETRRVALLAAQVVRDVPFAQVSRLAGPLAGDREPLLAAIKASQPPTPKPAAGGRATASGVRPDDDYFRGYVEPILSTRGKDGQACLHCHSSHTLFNGTLSTARNVINLADPEASLILQKPTSSAETEGVVNSGKMAHGGGVRFERGSPEYNTILNWIRGTKP